EVGMKTKKATIGLWVIQGLLAALFLFAGVMKLVMPIEALTQQIALPGWFLRFIGTCEVPGAIGLILPTALRIWPIFTSMAAAGLVVIMTGAVIISVTNFGVAEGILPGIVVLLCAIVIYGRGFRGWHRRSDGARFNELNVSVLTS